MFGLLIKNIFFLSFEKKRVFVKMKRAIKKIFACFFLFFVVRFFWNQGESKTFMSPESVYASKQQMNVSQSAYLNF